MSIRAKRKYNQIQPACSLHWYRPLSCTHRSTDFIHAIEQRHGINSATQRETFFAFMNKHATHCCDVIGRIVKTAIDGRCTAEPDFACPTLSRCEFQYKVSLRAGACAIEIGACLAVIALPLHICNVKLHECVEMAHIFLLRRR